jgi:DNA-binding CsgD family transcriptional regulator/PAS domain-containing protein
MQNIQERRTPLTTGSNYVKVYEKMLAIWESQDYAEVAIDYDRFVQDNPAWANLLNLSPCITYIGDIRTQQYCFISNNTKAILGYAPQLFLEKGLPFLNSITHPDDLPKTWNLVKKIWDFLIALPADKRKHYTFNHDYRLAKPDGTYIRILEQSSILQQDSNGNITHVMGICSDITHQKKHETLSASLVSQEDQICLFFTPDQEGQNPQKVLSKRELEIVKLIAEGYSSKLIADILCIGFHTVNTHRQNILRKTNTRNTGEFVQYAAGRGLI